MESLDFATILRVSSWAMIATGFVTFVACLFITAPYGRYSTSKGWGPLLPAKLTWFLMECPNLVMATIFVLRARAEGRELSAANYILLSLFVIHYFNRAILFPLKMNGNPMPISVMFLAMFYCSWNGFTQSLGLTVVNTYE